MTRSRNRQQAAHMALAVMAMACVAVLALAGNAFLSAAPVAKQTPTAPLLSDAGNVRAAVAVLQPAAEGASSALLSAGCAAVLLACAASARRSLRTPASRNMSRVNVAAFKSAFPAPQVFPEPVVALAAAFAPVLIELPLPEPVAAAVPIAPATPAPAVALRAANIPTSDASEKTSTFCGCTKLPGRRAGQARHTRARSASRASRAAAGVEQSARRSVGAKLQQAPTPEVASTSFDTSRLRTPIQLGLRLQSCMRSERIREARQPAASKGMSMGISVCILVNGYSDQTERTVTESY